jgi:hypothetical protein
MPRNFLLTALVIFLTPSAKAEPILLCGGDTAFVVDTTTAKDEIEKSWTWNAKQCDQLPEAMVAHVAVILVSAIDYGSLKTDAETDKWLRDNSGIYARIAEEIMTRKDVSGYRFATKENVRRGMVEWLDGYLEIQLNKGLSGADRVTTLIFEMANASRHQDHQQIDLAADEGLIRTPEEFGLAHEMIEFEALRIHRQILMELDSRAGPLPTEFFYFVTPTPRSIKDYQLPDLFQYLKTQKEAGHSDHYYKAFHLRKSERETPNKSSERTPIH